MIKNGFEFANRAQPFGARQLVDLVRHYCPPFDCPPFDGPSFDCPSFDWPSDAPLCLDEPAPRRAVCVETRMPGIHDQQRRSGALHRLGGETAELVRVSAGVPIPREIHQVARSTGAALHAIDVDEPRLARRRARARDPLAHQRVDQTRFPDIRTPDERDLRQAVPGQIARVRGTNDELGGNLQWVIVSSLIVSTGSAGACAGRRPASGSVSAIFKTSSIVWTM